MSNHLPLDNLACRKPHRLAVTLPHSVWEELIRRSTEEGRSVSNLGAYLIESALAIS